MFETDYNLTEEQKAMRQLAREIAEEKIKPVAAKYDEANEFPWEVVKILADAGLFGAFIEEKYGGTGGGVLDLCLITEELSRACGGISLSLAGTALGTFPIILYGNEEQKTKYLPEIASGKKLAAFALTEPDAGSDASAIKTSATKDGEHYIINGTKQWITNGGEAKVYSVITMTDKSRGARGATGFIIEDGTPGFSYGKKENKMGIRASATRELVFDNCRVHKSQILGKEGLGFFVAMKTFDASRPGVASQAVGIAQGALDMAIQYSRERKQFGKPICSFQGLQFMLADMATQVAAARYLTYESARAADNKHPNVGAISAMAKLFASDVAMKVTTDAVQIYGGYGYMKEYPVEKMMRDAKITQIYEGTNQIQREVIALELIKEAAKGR
ncbi:MAG: acyl-CoA dehydrogenase family protein [Planctomycetota bacterium]|nr:acyl-CoA dehydrogenase family protein [Planctomycetota bacterium]MDI6786964.1 acyl-CoA dehydrogenase family protein [Planctomycetota bacterium]